MAQIYRTNGAIEPYPEPANGTDYNLEEMRAAIGGGWIEIAHLSDGRLMVFDEEGKLKDLPPTPRPPCYGDRAVRGPATLSSETHWSAKKAKLTKGG